MNLTLGEIREQHKVHEFQYDWKYIFVTNTLAHTIQLNFIQTEQPGREIQGAIDLSDLVFNGESYTPVDLNVLSGESYRIDFNSPRFNEPYRVINYEGEDRLKDLVFFGYPLGSAVNYSISYPDGYDLEQFHKAGNIIIYKDPQGTHCVRFEAIDANANEN